MYLWLKVGEKTGAQDDHEENAAEAFEAAEGIRELKSALCKHFDLGLFRESAAIDSQRSDALAAFDRVAAAQPPSVPPPGTAPQDMETGVSAAEPGVGRAQAVMGGASWCTRLVSSVQTYCASLLQSWVPSAVQGVAARAVALVRRATLQGERRRSGRAAVRGYHFEEHLRDLEFVDKARAVLLSVCQGHGATSLPPPLAGGGKSPAVALAPGARAVPRSPSRMRLVQVMRSRSLQAASSAGGKGAGLATAGHDQVDAHLDLLEHGIRLVAALDGVVRPLSPLCVCVCVCVRARVSLSLAESMCEHGSGAPGRARPQVSKAWEPRVRASFTSPMAMLATASMWWAMLCSQLGALAGLFPSARLDIVRAMTGFLVPLSQVRRHTRQTYTAEISGLVSLSRAPAAPAGPRLGCPRRASLHASHACLIRPAACICHSIPTQCGKELPRTLLQAGPGAPACYACLVWLRSLASLCVQPGGRRWQGACCRWDKPAWPCTACRWASTACARAQSCGRSESSCAAAAPSRTLLLSRLRCRSCGLVCA